MAETLVTFAVCPVICAQRGFCLKICLMLGFGCTKRRKIAQKKLILPNPQFRYRAASESCGSLGSEPALGCVLEVAALLLDLAEQLWDHSSLPCPTCHLRSKFKACLQQKIVNIFVLSASGEAQKVLWSKPTTKVPPLCSHVLFFAHCLYITLVAWSLALCCCVPGGPGIIQGCSISAAVPLPLPYHLATFGGVSASSTRDVHTSTCHPAGDPTPGVSCIRP